MERAVGERGLKVGIGSVVATWDPHTHPIITEVAGKVVFTDLLEGVTGNVQTDEITGRTTYVILDPQRRRGSAHDIRTDNQSG